ncbi:MAG: hypothetical protein ABH872_06595 [Candidatus Omnitrophota bacterium]
MGSEGLISKQKGLFLLCQNHTIYERVLIYSSDWLIQGCVKIAWMFKLAPLFIGLILVAFGTSAPEAGVSIVAASFIRPVNL